MRSKRQVENFMVENTDVRLERWLHSCLETIFMSTSYAGAFRRGWHHIALVLPCQVMRGLEFAMLLILSILFLHAGANLEGFRFWLDEHDNTIELTPILWLRTQHRKTRFDWSTESEVQSTASNPLDSVICFCSLCDRWELERWSLSVVLPKGLARREGCLSSVAG